ncbi:hypothetical protein EDD16DRAFT_1701646 [Pisolithus croceorrhizus]|nr:hypothetical protein EDD16DRAFT_1701646 [Pisolithus croceorrhizus]KAI6162916.1 hypothetical protein EDD17DRAFT_1756948 [Pisolithus thermaeus]
MSFPVAESSAYKSRHGNSSLVTRQVFLNTHLSISLADMVMSSSCSRYCSSPHATPLPDSPKAWTEPLAGTALALPDHFKACALEGDLFVEYLQNPYEDEIPKRNHDVFRILLPIS